MPFLPYPALPAPSQCSLLLFSIPAPSLEIERRIYTLWASFLL